MKTCLDLFLTFAKIGFFTFGGGYAMIPLIQKEAAEDKDGAVAVVAITHVAREADLEAALAEIATCGVVTETPVRHRILGE